MTAGAARPGLLVAVLAFAGMCASFMMTILIPIQGELPALLDAAREDTAWTITVTLLVSAITNPIAGKLGDMYGKRRVAMVLLALLIAGSVVAALSATVVPLIVGRGLQGAGMGVIPLGISILRDTLHKDRLGSAIALVSATLGVGGALGLPISAVVTEHLDWHALFWVAAALGTVCFLLYFWVVPATQISLRTAGRFDFVGAVGLSAGLVGVLLAVSRGNDWGWSAPVTIACLAGGVLVLLAWGWYELRRQNPLVDVRTSSRGPVLITNLASVAMGFALFSSSIVFPQLLELPVAAGGLGLSLLQASLVLMPSGLAMLAMAPVVGHVERRVGPKPLLVAGALVISLTYLVAVVLDLGVWHVLLINTAIGIGIGLGYAAMPALVMRAVPVTETAASNGLNTLMRGLGTSLAAAAVAAVLAQSATEVGGFSVPSSGGFQLALILGLVAAVVCAVLAVLIPKPRDIPGETASLPEGAL